LEKIISFKKSNNKIFYYESSSFHAKIYLFRKKTKSLTAIVGSSNFTMGGLQDNYEFNVLLNEQLDEIDKYLAILIKRSDGLLSEQVVESYKKNYKPPVIPTFRRNNKVDNKNVLGYKDILDRWGLIKGILENHNPTNLPFTYVFDSFCHEFKVHMTKSYGMLKLEKFNKDELIKYFKIFIKDYFSQESQNYRNHILNECKSLRDDIDNASKEYLTKFFLNIHSISYGSGKGVRITHFSEKATKSDMKKLLQFLIKEKLSMPEKYAIGLTDKSNGGEKIRYIGPSSLGEIPGWLFPEEYPIVNSKFHYILDFFKIK
jgi:hypothetical protein